MLPSFPMTAGVTLLIVLLLFATAFAVGRGRHKYGVAAPAVAGHPAFERLYRVQMNTLEWAVMTLPCLWIAAAYVSDALAAGLGGLWLLGRIAYALAYAADPAKRRRCSWPPEEAGIRRVDDAGVPHDGEIPLLARHHV